MAVFLDLNHLHRGVLSRLKISDFGWNYTAIYLLTIRKKISQPGVLTRRKRTRKPQRVTTPKRSQLTSKLACLWCTLVYYRLPHRRGRPGLKGDASISPMVTEATLKEMARSDDPIIRSQFDRIKYQIKRLYEAVQDR